MADRRRSGDTLPMCLSRLLVLIAVLACASVTAQAHVGPFGSAAETARRGFLPDLGATSRVIERVTAGHVWENYDCAREAASGSCVDAFGVEIARSGATEVEHLYRGEAFDDKTGLYYLRARWMDPSNGRFTQQDTWLGRKKKPTSLNKYVYAESDPVTYSDPSGHFVAGGGFGAAPTIAAIQATAAVGAQSALRIFATRALVALGTAAITVTAGTLTTQTQTERSALADPRALANARVILKNRVETETRRRKKDDVVYHYTDRAAALKIYSSGVMRTSAPYKGRLGNGIYKPAGAYATDIQPWSPIHTQVRMSAMFYGGSTNRDVSWFVALDADGFSPVYSTPHEYVKYGMYPGEVDVEPVYFGPSLISR
jgi:RHS repeat-associated protein